MAEISKTIIVIQKNSIQAKFPQNFGKTLKNGKFSISVPKKCKYKFDET